MPGWLTTLPGLSQPVFTQTHPGRVCQRRGLLLRVLGPRAQGLKPGRKIAPLQHTAIHLLVLHALLDQPLQFIRPLQPRCFQVDQCLRALVQTVNNEVLQLTAGWRELVCKQRMQRTQQPFRALPVLRYPVERITVQRVTLFTPIVARNFCA